MNCNDIRKYFYAFVDGELDVERNIEILSHLDICFDCSKKVETERILQKRVKETVCKTATPDYLRQKLYKRIEIRPGFMSLLKENLLSKSRLIPLGAIATILIMVASFFIIQNYMEKNSILHVAESRYHDLLTKQLETDIRSQSTVAIAKYIQDKAGLNVTLPDINGSAKLVGAAVSTIKDKDVPLIFYIIEDIPVALYIMSNASIDLSRMKEEITNDTVIYRGKGFCDTCQIIGWQENNNQYIMVSKLNSNRMIGMLTKV